MSPVAIALTGISVLLVLLAFRIPVAFAMFLVGFIGVWSLNGLNAAMGLLASESGGFREVRVGEVDAGCCRGPH